LKIFYNQKGYSDRLRRIRYFDLEMQRFFVYLTNHFTLPLLTIALLDKSQWQVGLVQVDQTESPDQKLFWHIFQRSQNTDLDCCMRLCTGRDSHKRIESLGEPSLKFSKFLGRVFSIVLTNLDQF